MTTQHKMAIASVGEAERVIANLEKIMDALLSTVEEETALVRAGRLNEATQLEVKKTELAGHYLADTERLKAGRHYVERSLPAALHSLRERHNSFHALLQINLAVLATAHAVSEGIIRGVSEEVNRNQAPTTYGATGRANATPPKQNQPLAICRTL